MQDEYHNRVSISIHALCEEGDLPVPSPQDQPPYFYPRPLRGGRRLVFYRGQQNRIISIHALCEEGDLLCLYSPPCYNYFYPRPLRGGRHKYNAKCTQINLFLSTPSARRATHSGRHGIGLQAISIHALCEEGDVSAGALVLAEPISIHALCEEGDDAPPLRAALPTHFYPRPLRGGRR